MKITVKAKIEFTGKPCRPLHKQRYERHLISDAMRE
jgi:hypothetical protein